MTQCDEYERGSVDEIHRNKSQSTFDAKELFDRNKWLSALLATRSSSAFLRKCCLQMSQFQHYLGATLLKAFRFSCFCENSMMHLVNHPGCISARIWKCNIYDKISQHGL